MIISASRRTDLPAFFPEWTIKEILKLCKAEQQSLIPCSTPKHGVVFWTKNPEPIIPYLNILDKNNIKYYFQFTYNDYPEFEPNVPNLYDRHITYAKLGKLIGFDKIKVRFDPILVGINNRLSIEKVMERYYCISKTLHKNTKDITFSFLDYYPKLPPTVRTLTISECDYALDYLVKNIGDRFKLYSCAEGVLSRPPILQGKCIDPEMFIKMGLKLDDVDSKDKSQRLMCKCYPSKDIGTYHSCMHCCSYCYAK
jgi:DNA repair photolyase